jgi:hypothetical protein
MSTGRRPRSVMSLMDISMIIDELELARHDMQTGADRGQIRGHLELAQRHLEEVVERHAGRRFR